MLADRVAGAGDGAGDDDLVGFSVLLDVTAVYRAARELFDFFRHQLIKIRQWPNMAAFLLIPRFSMIASSWGARALRVAATARRAGLLVALRLGGRRTGGGVQRHSFRLGGS
jgi:hypothetical protein